MTGGGLRRMIVTALTLAVAGAGLAGCVSDLGATTATSATSHQMRYYGGPKSPMWPGS